jgi:hypothetical protein
MVSGGLQALLVRWLNPSTDQTQNRSSCGPRRSKSWLSIFEESVSRLRGHRSRRRTPWKVAQGVEAYEARMLLSGMPPFAVANSYGVSKDSYTVAASGVLGNDYDMESDPLTAVLFSNPTNGAVTLNSNGGFTYTPNVGYAGSDSFQYKAFDGTSYSSAATVTLTVTNSWSAQTNSEDRIYKTADDFGSVGVVSFNGNTLASASVGDGQQLIYSSNSEPNPVIAVETDFNGGSPTSLEAVLTFNSVAGSTVYYNTTGISGTTRLRFALQANASSLATGKYAWSMSLKGVYSDGSSSTRNFTGSSYIVNWNSNSEGDSWNIADMDRLVSVSGGMLWVQ